MRKTVKRSLSLILCAALLLALLPAGAFAEGDTPLFAGGDGTAANPYQIATAAQLKNLADMVNSGADGYSEKTFKLTADIDLGVYESWTPIGTSEFPFCGSLNGDGYTISNITVPDTYRYSGLFGYVGQREYGASFSGLNLENVNVSGVYSGGLVGYAAHDGDVWAESCAVSGTVNGASYAGGLVGVTYTLGVFKNCSFEGSVSGGFSGGIAGSIGHGYYEMINDLVTECWTDAEVSGSSAAGGLVGRLSVYGQMAGAVVRDSYVLGDVSSGSDIAYLGGIVGMYDLGSSGAVRRCYFTGNISGGAVAGGISNAYCEDDINTPRYLVESSVALGAEMGSRTGYRISLSGQIIRTTYTNNYALAGMLVNGSTVTGAATDGNGADISAEDALSAVFWRGLGFDESIWTLEDGYLPGFGAPTAPPVHLAPLFAGGDGTEANPYRIATAAQLKNMADLLNGGEFNYAMASYILIDDIDLGVYESWTPISGPSNDHYFEGRFNGDGHTVSNLTVTSGPGGLFGSVFVATIENLTLENVTLLEGGGGIVDRARSSSISNCHVSGSISGGTYGGGIIGTYEYNSISDCSFTGSVSSQYAGGLVGNGIANSSTFAYIYRSWVNADVYGELGAGGVSASYDVGINDCYVLGTVRGGAAGGFIGKVSAPSQRAYINRSYSAADVYGTDYAGGFIGEAKAIIIPDESYPTRIENSVSLAGSLEGGSANEVFRISNWAKNQLAADVFSNNYAFSGMLVNGATVTGTREDRNGESVSGNSLLTAAFWRSLGLDETIWTIEDGYLPGLSGSGVEPPSHLRDDTDEGITALILPEGDEVSLSVRALIDGDSALCIKGGRLWWENYSYDAPGKHGGGREATYLNGEEWYPGWPDGWTGEVNSTSLPINVNVTELYDIAGLEVITGRAAVSYEECEDGVLRIRFQDGPQLGSAWYEVELAFTAKEPALPEVWLTHNILLEGTEAYLLVKFRDDVWERRKADHDLKYHGDLPFEVYAHFFDDSADEALSSALFVDGVARLHVPEVPSPTEMRPFRYRVRVEKTSISEFRYEFLLYIRPYNRNIWTANAAPKYNGKLELHFNAKIGSFYGQYDVTVNGAPCAASKISDSILELDTLVENLPDTSEIVVKGLQLVELFPSYHFTYRVTYTK